MQTAIGPSSSGFDSEPLGRPRQSDERRVRRSFIADHRSPPRTSVAVLHSLAIFHEVSSSSMIFFSRHTVANCRGCPATVSRWSNEHDELCLLRGIREPRFVLKAASTISTAPPSHMWMMHTPAVYGRILVRGKKSPKK